MQCFYTSWGAVYIFQQIFAFIGHKFGFSQWKLNNPGGWVSVDGIFGTLATICAVLIFTFSFESPYKLHLIMKLDKCKPTGHFAQHLLQQSCLQSKTDAVYDAVSCPRLLPFMVRPHLEYAMQACSPNRPIIWGESSGWRRGSTDCHMRNDYVGWVCTPYAGVASVETS